jgi:hypothetical protein
MSAAVAVKMDGSGVFIVVVDVVVDSGDRLLDAAEGVAQARRQINGCVRMDMHPKYGTPVLSMPL